MGNVGEGPTMDESRGMLQSLDQVWLQGVLQQSGHGTLRFQIMSGDRLAIISVSHDHTGQAGLQIGDIRGQAQNSHDLGCHGDLKAILAGNTLGFTS